MKYNPMYRQNYNKYPDYNYNNNNNNRFGGFLLPFALGFVSSPLIFGAANQRPMYGPYPYPYPPYYYRPY